MCFGHVDLEPRPSISGLTSGLRSFGRWRRTWIPQETEQRVTPKWAGIWGWWQQLRAVISFLTPRHIAANHRGTQTFMNVHKTPVPLESGKRSAAGHVGSWTSRCLPSEQVVPSNLFCAGHSEVSADLVAWPEPRVSTFHDGQVTPSLFPWQAWFLRGQPLLKYRPTQGNNGHVLVVSWEWG